MRIDKFYVSCTELRDVKHYSHLEPLDCDGLEILSARAEEIVIPSDQLKISVVEPHDKVKVRTLLVEVPNYGKALKFQVDVRSSRPMTTWFAFFGEAFINA